MTDEEWQKSRANFRSFLAGLDPGKINELLADMVIMLDYHSSQIKKSLDRLEFLDLMKNTWPE